MFIDSLGGSVEEAIAVGRMIRARHLDVVVTRTESLPCQGAACRPATDPRPAHPRGFGSVCASACVLILAGGQKRDAAPWALVGIHQIIRHETMTRTRQFFRVLTREEHGVKVILSRTLISERPISTVHFTAPPPAKAYRMVSDYLAAMGVGAALMPLMLATPPSGIHWMTEAEEAATAIVTDSVDGEYVSAQAERAGSAVGTSVDSIPEVAALLIAGTGSAEPQTFPGRVTWSLDPAPDGLSPVALRAAVEIPGAGLTAAIRITNVRNPDHLAVPEIDVALVPAANAAIHSIERVALPRMRSVQPPSVNPLTGTVLPAGEDAYAFRLSDDAARSTANMASIEGMPWVDIPMLVNGGSVAVLSFEHGRFGTPLIKRAFEAWISASPTPSPAPAIAPKS